MSTTPAKVTVPKTRNKPDLANSNTKSTGATLFIGNVPFNASENDVRQFFNSHEIKDLRLACDKDGGFKGYAYATFASKDAAASALQLNKEKMLTGPNARTIRLEYAPEPRKPRKKATLIKESSA